MSNVDAINNEINKLMGVAEDIRYDVLTMCHECGKQNGHLGGCMSVVEILTTLYCHETNLISANLGEVYWEDRDRVILSKGHASLAMYSALKHAGVISNDMISDGLRCKDTILYRHSKRNTDYAIEYSAGSLGLGLGFGIGVLEALKRKNSPARVFVIVGDGECNEGSIWESAAYAGARGLENLIVIVDSNKLQLDGFTKDVLNFDNMAERWSSFGFETISVNGHNFEELISAFSHPHKNKPLAIIANTVKGKGVSFAENKVEWHGNYLDDVSFNQAVKLIGLSEFRANAINDAEILFKKKNHKHKPVNNIEDFNFEFDASYWNSFCEKQSVGEISYEIAKKRDDFVLIYSDCGRRIGAEKIAKFYPNAALQVGISEQNQILIASGLASEGYKVVVVSYAPFITGRVYDQLHVCMGYMELPMVLVGLSSGFDSSDLGSTHTMFTDIGLMYGLGNTDIYFPKNSVDVAQMIVQSLENNTPSYIRITSNKDNRGMNIQKLENSFNNLIWFGDCDQSDICIVSIGAVSYEAIKAYEILNHENINISLCIIPCTKLIDDMFIEKLNKQKLVYVLEEHNEMFGIKSILLNKMSDKDKCINIKSIALTTNYYLSNLPNVLRQENGLNASNIAKVIRNEKCEK